ncbi:MAG: acetyl-CoA carboxylase biotin carboxyl carrier protein [Acinetobacter sp.]|nr:acetyl-CoA carboxylase biotin carboxyl carrier protein [Acinetobacter sp.]
MDIRKIKKLIDLMIESDLHAIEVKEGDQSIALTRQAPQQAIYAAAPVANAAPVAAAPTAPAASTAPTAAGKVETSPMVGVFYAAPSPDEAPFVKVGQSVKAGQTLCIVEAMKIMNPIEATQDGVIEEILVNNGDVVQFGQPLFRLRA